MTPKLFLIFAIIIGAPISILAQPRPTPTPTPTRPVNNLGPTAQPNLTVAVPPTKIAVVDTDMFSDDKAGIYRLVDAIKIVQGEFRGRQQELQNLQTRINTLIQDIRKLSAVSGVVDQKSIEAKQAEGARLQQDLETKQQRFDEDYSKRYREVTGSISEQIGKELDSFATQHGITMTLDLAKLMPAILTAVPTVEITQAFIAEFNRKYPRTGPATRP